MFNFPFHPLIPFANMSDTTSTTLDLSNILKFSLKLAREAGVVILEGSDAILRSKTDEIEEKKNSVDLVTEYDKGVEDLVRKRIKSTYPNFNL